MSNDYDKLSDDYKKTHEKPDKRYSTLPTLLDISGDLTGKKVLDIGCGDGYFTKEFSKTAKEVIGIDNSKEQIQKALETSPQNVSYLNADMNTWEYPKDINVLFAPYVICYQKTEDKLENLFSKFYNSLSSNGMLIGVVDMPKREVHDMRKFGAIKKVSPLKQGSDLTIDLYNDENLLVTLHSTYHKKNTIEKYLEKVGFSKTEWKKPIISEEGISSLGKEFWSGYIEDCDLAYFIAYK